MPAPTEDRHERQQAILKIVGERAIARQAELVELLRRRGFRATQSSVSRDLRQLGIVKLESGYASPPAPADVAEPPADLVRAVRPAGPNLTVVNTAIGAAARVAVYLDRAGWPEIVGTVSGDDTIFVATSGAAEQRRLLVRLQQHFGA